MSYCNACDEHPKDPKSAKGYCCFCQEVEDAAKVGCKTCGSTLRNSTLTRDIIHENDCKKVDGDERRCPACGGPDTDIIISIDETADCYSCNWKGHEDDLIEKPK